MSIDEKNKLISKIETALDDIRPHLKVDGGNVEVVDVTDDMCLQIRWLGNCRVCSMSEMTMRAGVEATVKDKVPAIASVVAINAPTTNA